MNRQSAIVISYYLISILVMISFSGCNSGQKNQKVPLDSKNVKKEIVRTSDSIDIEMMVESSIKNSIDSIDVMIIPCANGYEYKIHGYDFNPIIEHTLNDVSQIKVHPFPVKKLIGVPYQGVFEKKYCAPILEKVQVSYLIMIRFTDNPFSNDPTKRSWGYQTRILKTKTMEQVNSISATGLLQYAEIEEHIQSNIDKLRSDIEQLHSNE
ncbi:hypothetical protein GCM10022393_22630 [Aquimarina addita]|uniref:Uncharacterized protein n=1 Tax=Aquimarina addita TaxID=870485 RepID=A0ABP6UM98_9FLAO